MLFDDVGEPLGAENGAVLPTGASKLDGKVCEVPFEVFVDALCDDGFGVGEKLSDSGVVLQELYDGLVFACVVFVFWVATWVGKGSTVENVPTAVSRVVGWQTLFVTE